MRAWRPDIDVLFLLLLSGCAADSAPGRIGRDASTDTNAVGSQSPDPELMPRNGRIVWESTRAGGRSEIFIVNADGSGMRQLTRNGGLSPSWSPDGQWIAYLDIADNSAHLMRPDGSGDQRPTVGRPLFWMHDGSGLVCRVGDDFALLDPETHVTQHLFNRRDFAQIGNHVLQPGGITRDGRWMVAGTDRFRNGALADNGAFRANFAAVILDLTDKTRLYFFGPGCAPRTPPAGNLVFHVCGDCPTFPDVYRMSLDDLSDRSSYQPELAHPDHDWGHAYFPRISNDNQWLIYGASTGCHDKMTCDYEIFLHRLGQPSDQRVRITEHAALDRFPDIHIPPQ